MNIFQAAKALGGVVARGNTVNCPGPGHSARDRSLSVKLTGGSDFTVFSYAGDDWRVCKDHVRARLGLGEFSRADTRPAFVTIAPAGDDKDRSERAMAIWRQAVSIKSTPAEAYLTSRGLQYSGTALRWHPSCPFGKGERHACMVALVRNIETNEPQAIHRTAIDSHGLKVDRKALGPIGGGAVKLTEDAEGTNVIAIGEGIETALSIRKLSGLGTMPVWSVLSAGGIAAFPALPGFEAVWIAADNDVTGTGQKAARAAAERLVAAGIETIILAATQAGTDLNDWVARHG